MIFSKHKIIQLSKAKDRKRIVKAAGQKIVTYKGSPLGSQRLSQQKIMGQEGAGRCIQSAERKNTN